MKWHTCKINSATHLYFAKQTSCNGNIRSKTRTQRCKLILREAPSSEGRKEKGKEEERENGRKEGKAMRKKEQKKERAKDRKGKR